MSSTWEAITILALGSESVNQSQKQLGFQLNRYLSQLLVSQLEGEQSGSRGPIETHRLFQNYRSTMMDVRGKKRNGKHSEIAWLV